MLDFSITHKGKYMYHPNIILSILLAMTLFFNFNCFASKTDTPILKEVVEYLASDALEGRRAGSKGNVTATNYLDQKLQSFGLQPLGTSFQQEFTIFTKMIKHGDNKLEVVNGHGPAQNFQPISYSLSGDLKNTPMVFAGFGISIPKTDPKLQYDDYENVNVKGKIVVILTGDPGIGNANSLFRDPAYINYRSIFYKLKNAINHGAKGILVIQDPLSLPNINQEPMPYFNATEGGGKRFSIIAGYINNNWYNRFVPKNNNTLDIQKKIALTQKPQSFELSVNFNMSVHLKKETGRVANVVAVKKGTDPLLKNEVIVIGAHFDHLGFGGESSMDPTHSHKVHNGADDNASGTAVVMEMAKRIAKVDTKRTYVFSLFNAEEVGLLGSSHFVDMWARHTKDYGAIKAMINFDMVGRYNSNKNLTIMGIDSELNWKKTMDSIVDRSMTIQFNKTAVGSSDHASFLNKGIPSLFFTTGAHADYHRSSDDTAKINFRPMYWIMNYSLRLIKKLELTPSLAYNPNYDNGTPSDGSSRGYGAHLGCVPKFGQSDDITGVVCTRASANSPAESAGIITGDILTQIGEIKIKSIYDLAFALKYYRAGDKIELAWIRNNKTMKANITLAQSSPHKKINKGCHFKVY